MKEVRNIHSVKDFLSCLRQMKCVCFGAGRKLDEICRELPELVKEIAYIIDNNPALHETERKIYGESKPIHSPQILETEDVSGILLIVTSSYKKEIMSQLEQNKRFFNMSYCEVGHILDEEAYNVDCPPVGYRQNTAQTIPRKLHYIWFSDQEIPQPLQKNIDGWKRLCPDYEICRWDEHNYDVTKNPYMYEAYRRGMWSFVSDYARLDIVYENGGIYLDTDVELLRRPDELLYNDAFIGFERISSVNTGSGFGAKKGFPLILEMRELYNNLELTITPNPSDMTLCPVYETALLVRHGLKLNGSFQIVDGMSVYPVMYLNAKSQYSGRLLVTKETVSVHHCTWTWAGAKNKLNGEART